jgi:uncharacterized membrane protein YkvA (DUF1232 family)
MRLNLARARVLLFEVPRTAKVAYCLMRDPRAPLGPKIAAGAALGLIASPLDVPAWIPVIGDLDVLALGVLAIRVFVDACPDELVDEHRASVQSGESIFDHDLRLAMAAAYQVGRRLSSNGQARPADRETRESEDESA